MSILSTNNKLVRVGAEYSAGPNIDIQNCIISGKDWTDEIAEASANAYNAATAEIPDPFDPSYLSAQIDNKLNSSDFTTWQNGQYTTDLQTIEGQINNKLDTSSFSDVSGSFLTAHQSLDNYYTKDETSGKEELAQAFSDIPVGDPEVNAYVTNNSATLNGTTDLVQNSSGLWNDVAVYQSNSANYLTAHQDISYKLDESAFADVSGTFLTAINIPESASWEEATQAYEQNSGTYLTAHQSLDGYATEDWVTGQGYITGVSIPESATWQDVSTTVQTNSADWASHQDLSYISAQVDIKLDESAFADVSGTFLTAHQDLSDYYTTADANTLSSMFSGAIDYVSANAGDEFPVSADEAIQYVQTNSGTIDDTVTSYQTNSGTYLTAHQSLEGYAVESAFEYNSNDLITAYNGSAFAGQGGGGDVPTGTMNVSGLEYNAVNEISGYNGSAIAQYGAEKQWLVHDDTLVHAANSAQYALGVNLSAVAQLLGVDETVLWETTSNNSIITANESVYNFDYARFYMKDDNNDFAIINLPACLTATRSGNYMPFATGDSTRLVYVSSNDGIIWSADGLQKINSTAYTPIGNGYVFIKKIVGVHRISD